MPAAIETQGLTRSFNGATAVTSLTLDAEPGEVVVLLGPNGAGKTTTIRLLNGVLTPDSGWSRVMGFDPVREGDDVRRRTGVLTENAGLDDRLTFRENLLLAARIRGMSNHDAAPKVATMLGRFGMGAMVDRAVAGASTGERKRAALARALLHDPDVLFLDEPTSGLDPEATRDVVEMIAALAAEHGRTVVLCTHFLLEAGRLADRMAVLDRGQLRAFGRPAELAATLWRGLEAELDLGEEAGTDLLATLRSARGVLSADASPLGAVVRVDDRSVLPSIVALLVGREIPVYAAMPRPPTLEDVYFALRQPGPESSKGSRNT